MLDCRACQLNITMHVDPGTAVGDVGREGEIRQP